MKKLMEDRERHVKLQTEVDSQTKQLSEKEDQLQKWRQERDELVAALEVQLKNLFASNLQKDQELKKLQEVASAQPHEVNKDELQLTLARKEAEIAELKEYVSNMKVSKDKHQAAVTASGDTSMENKLEAKSTKMANTKFVQQLQDEHSKLTSSIKTVCDGPKTKIAALPRRSSTITLHEEENEVVLNQSVLDSSEVSTENGRTSRFPKSELDVQFTPLRPNKMTVTRQGGDSSVTVKITRTAKKRKSNAMEKTMLSGCWKNKSKLKATSPSVSQQSEEKHQADRRKWLDEKMLLIRQAKEAEGRRNQEMKKLMEDRERHVKLQTEVDSQTKQLSEKEDQLQKWRQERDELVAALEVQLKNLFASNLQKDQELKKLQEVASAQPHEVNKDELQLTLARKEAEIAELKEYVSNMKVSKDKHQAAVTASGDTSMENKLEAKSTKMANTKFVQQLQDEHSKLTSSIKTVCDGPKTKIAALPRRSSTITLHEEENEVVLNQSVLDSSEVSTENGRTSRFPKSELDIQFTPLRPNKMTVTRQGGDSSVTVKITRTAKKRKSNAMEKLQWQFSVSYLLDPVEGENKKNTNSRVIASSQSIKTANNGKEVGPSSIQINIFKVWGPRVAYLVKAQAKKLIGSRSMAKSPETDVCKETEYKPRKSKRKLYKTEISSPLDIPSHPDPVEGENKKNTNSRVIASSQSIKTANNGKEVGPSSIQINIFKVWGPRVAYLVKAQAKKLIGSRSMAKSPETDVCKEIEYKPRKSKRKLYKTEISSPLDIPSHPVVGLDQDEKESDHLIIKRRLRTRTAKR
ncbi:UNVERIFIED_CONTAM: hypothetical protein FKN15_056124 [Acipenser sinensis]